MRLANKTAIITGAASGMGEAAARLFAAEGASVLAVDIDEVQGRLLANESDGSIGFARADVGVAADVERVAAEAMAEWGRIDILVNNAGLPMKRDVFDTSEDEFDRIIAVNLKSVFLFCKAVGPHMVAAGHGSIVNNASSAALFAGNRVGVYGAAKGGVVSFTRNLAIELARSGVRINAICPHATLTPGAEHHMASLPDPGLAKDRLNNMNPIGRPGKPIEIARLMLFLGSDDSSLMTGAVIPVDGGASAQGGDRF